MKNLKALACMVLILCSTSIYAGNNNKRWNEYKSGPALKIWDDNGIALEYYFLKDNTMSIGFNTIPYQYIKNEDAVLK